MFRALMSQPSRRPSPSGSRSGGLKLADSGPGTISDPPPSHRLRVRGLARHSSTPCHPRPLLSRRTAPLERRGGPCRHPTDSARGQSGHGVQHAQRAGGLGSGQREPSGRRLGSLPPKGRTRTSSSGRRGVRPDVRRRAFRDVRAVTPVGPTVRDDRRLGRGRVPWPVQPQCTAGRHGGREPARARSPPRLDPGSALRRPWHHPTVEDHFAAVVVAPRVLVGDL